MGGGVRGFTVIEVLVAVALFAIVAAALAQTLMTAQRVRASSARWLQATALAEDRLERVRAGDRSADAAPIGEFTRSWQAEPSSDAPGCERVEVVVTWDDRGPQRFALTALQRIAR
jgi:prepilin-type N-terminal cleavage/methylation domain-containing protein